MLGIKLGLGVNSIVRLHISELRALITSLFGNGEQGAFYIPMPVVLGTQALFQDSAGTVPVTADGDPVGRMLDQSENGNHAIQTVSGSRPVYRTDGTLHWLEFDGIDDSIANNFYDLIAQPVTHALALVATVTARSYAFSGIDASNRNDYWGISTDLNIQMYAGNIAVSAAYPRTTDATVAQMLFNGGQSVYRHNGNTENIGNPGLDGVNGVTIGSRYSDTDHFQGKIYAFITVDRELNNSESDNLNKYLADLSGVTL